MRAEDLARGIERCIQRKQLLKKRVAADAGFSEQMFSDMLNGRKIIRAEYMPRIARAIGVEISDIYDAAKEKAACAMAIHRRQERAKVIREDAETGERTVFPGRSLDDLIEGSFSEDIGITIHYETGRRHDTTAAGEGQAREREGQEQRREI